MESIRSTCLFLNKSPEAKGSQGEKTYLNSQICGTNPLRPSGSRRHERMKTFTNTDSKFVAG